MTSFQKLHSAKRRRAGLVWYVPGFQGGAAGLVRGGSVLCAVLLLLLGALVLLGWTVHSDFLVAVVPGHVGMKVNTALCFLMSGGALWLAERKRAWAAAGSRLASAGVLLVSGASLAEYVLQRDLHLDQTLFRDTAQLVFPGRMAEVTAVGFCLGGVALLLMLGGRGARRLSQTLGLLLMSLAYGSMVGYLFGVPVFYGSFRAVNTMALHTGLGILVLGCGLVVRSRDSTMGRLLASGARGGWLVRRGLPVLAIFPALLGFVYLHPAVNFGQLRFGMALFALTLALGGMVLLVVVGLFFDRTEERQRALMEFELENSKAIEASERELRLLTDHLPLLLAYVDLEGRYLRVNRTYEDWLGLSADEVIGRTIRELVGEEYWRGTEEARRRAAGGEQVHWEAMYPTTRGERRALITWVPSFGEGGKVQGFACMALDVEDQRRAEEALRQSEKLAAVGRLASSIAHEINNPVDAAMNLLFLVKEETEDQGLRNLLETAEGELKRVANIAGKTLGFHKQTMYPEMVAATDLFDSVLTLHDRRLRHRGIQVARRERAERRVKCIEGEIRQVLNNLVSNAVDAMGAGGSLVLRSREATDWRSGRRGVMLTVADDGCGMDERTLARLFEAFFTTKGTTGTGLGLWISAEILARHGSRMLVRSSMRATAHGTVFGIFLPFDGPVHLPAVHTPEALELARQMELTGR